ncbi:hypothetical protein LFYK43_00370 [Ligilactobacillus salitolerans]|uniref:UDP-N-acetylglucosamine kinase n=1 Tax=Ligilactobacillus salitolerans TaxID=1808352 RepID=A0A401IPW3_9LACO|nr:AAA family ATPase [Ligilactobacillus salitolerans]GBG93578.1 hypothetical protein LFYK43_00370 [Ligilactobacillus salitolerans]
MTKLIILRGNSGSGKTTTAYRLQQALQPAQVLVVGQDVVRRQMLNVKDTPGNPSIELMEYLCRFGKNRYDYVILEGILGAAKYRDMLLHLLSFFEKKTFVYYFDLPFEETVRRNNQRATARRFDMETLHKWWLEKDFLQVPEERAISAEMNPEQLVNRITTDLNN